jgi:hypothetical protein
MRNLKPSLFIAAGCSWVAGKSIDIDSTSDTILWDHVEDPEFVKQHSFAGILSKSYDTFQLLAESGSNNTEQISRTVKFLEQNRDQYSQVFVLWGITSLYRWQMYSAATGLVEDCVHTSIPFKTDKDFRDEIKYYFSHFFDGQYELEKLNTQAIMFSGYLKSINVDHLFVNAFQDNPIAIDNFYPTDLLTLLHKQNNLKITEPFLNVMLPNQTYPNNIVKLQELGWLDKSTAHPTVKAHALIAKELGERINA